MIRSALTHAVNGKSDGKYRLNRQKEVEIEVELPDQPDTMEWRMVVVSFVEHVLHLLGARSPPGPALDASYRVCRASELRSEA